MPGVVATATWQLALVPEKRSRPSIPWRAPQMERSRWINVSILALPAAADGEAPLVVHLCRDATDIKQQERFARQILSLVDSLQQADAPARSASAMGTLAGKLTDRGIQVLTLLAQGLSTEKIAETLSVSRATTRNHIQNILQKLRVHSLPRLSPTAFEHGIVV